MSEFRTFRPEEKAAHLRDVKKNKTGYLGVTYKARDKRFVARIRVPGQKEKLYAGSAKTAAEAARLYDKKALELFGPAAVLNFPKVQP